MKTSTVAQQENKSQSVANAVSQKSSNALSSLQKSGGIPKTTGQSKYQEIVDNSSHVSQLMFFQEIANKTSQAKSADYQAITEEPLFQLRGEGIKVDSSQKQDAIAKADVVTQAEQNARQALANKVANSNIAERSVQGANYTNAANALDAVNMNNVSNRAAALNVGTSEYSVYRTLLDDIKVLNKRNSDLNVAVRTINALVVAVTQDIDVGAAGLAANRNELRDFVNDAIAGNGDFVAGTIVAAHAENDADTGWQLRLQAVPNWPWPGGGQANMTNGSIPGLAHNAHNLNAARNALRAALTGNGYA